MRLGWVLILTLAVPAGAQDGAGVYRERCASCHDSPQGKAPSLDAIKSMSGESIVTALTNGAMKDQARGLTTQELIALVVYIAPTGGSNAKPAFEKSCSGAVSGKASMGSWGGWSPSVTNSRYQDASAAGLSIMGLLGRSTS